MNGVRLGQWLTFCGRSDQPSGSLNVRASDLILKVGGVWIGGEPVFPHRIVYAETPTEAEAEAPVVLNLSAEAVGMLALR